MWARKPFDYQTIETSPFGHRTHPVTGRDSFHSGIDFSMPVGTPLIAIADGEIIAKEDDLNGKYIQLLFTTEQGTKGLAIYCHCSKMTKKKTVKAGDIIGYSGNTGRSTGPHLHFGLKLSLGKKNEFLLVNPTQYVNFR